MRCTRFTLRTHMGRMSGRVRVCLPGRKAPSRTACPTHSMAIYPGGWARCGCVVCTALFSMQAGWRVAEWSTVA